MSTPPRSKKHNIVRNPYSVNTSSSSGNNHDQTPAAMLIVTPETAVASKKQRVKATTCTDQSLGITYGPYGMSYDHNFHPIDDDENKKDEKEKEKQVNEDDGPKDDKCKESGNKKPLVTGDSALVSIKSNSRYKSATTQQVTLTQIDRAVQHDKNKIEHTTNSHTNNSPCHDGKNQETFEDDDEGGTLVHSFGGNISVQKPGDEVCDIHGFRIGTDGAVLPSHYCLFCRCPPMKCHERMFGEFIQLQVVSDMMDIDLEPTAEHVKDAVQDEYTRKLKDQIYDETKALDISTYNVPYCLEAGTQAQLLEYVKTANYHYEMQKRITMGRDKSVFAEFGKNKRTD